MGEEIINMMTSEDHDVRISSLQLYFGDPFVVDNITIYQPTIGDILEYDKKFGEDEFWSTLNVFIGNPTMYRLMLWDLGIDWNKITDFQLFISLIKTVDLDHTYILFKDLDFSKFELFLRKKPSAEGESDSETTDSSEESEEIVMYNIEDDIEINEKVYTGIANYLRAAFNIYPKVEKAKGKITKEWIIEEDRMNYERRKKEPSSSSTLLPLISSCLNHPGFKYKKNELKDVGICEFMDSVQRLQIYEQSTALLKGSYSGFIDTSKIPNEQFNFMREIIHDNKKIK